MDYKYVNLYELIQFVDDPKTSERYVKYICGHPDNQQYRHTEILDIQQFLHSFKLSFKEADGFLYGYKTPRVVTEFDLLKFGKDYCVDIELKGQDVPIEKVKSQLEKKSFYLNLTNKKLHLFTYFADSGELFAFDNGTLRKAEVAELKALLQSMEHIDLDEMFSAKNILASPYNHPYKFLGKKYLLTDHQQKFKKKTLEKIENDESRIFAIEGGSGTGKSLLAMDIAKELAKQGKTILFLFGGNSKNGHKDIMNVIPGITIITPYFFKSTVKSGKYDVLIIDEAQRVYPNVLDTAVYMTKINQTICFFVYDPQQMMSDYEYRSDNPRKIKELCPEDCYCKLTKNIRSNEEVARFADCLLDQSKRQKGEIFPNIGISFIADKGKAIEKVRCMILDGYNFIPFTDSFYTPRLIYQTRVTNLNSHRAIGQEYEKVVVVMDENFFYDGKILKAHPHPVQDYIFEKLLYQALTRACESILIIVTDKSLYYDVMRLFDLGIPVSNGEPRS